MPGFFELPECWLEPDEDPQPPLLAKVRDELGIEAEFSALGLMGEARHSITRYRLHCALHRLDAGSAPSGSRSRLLDVEAIRSGDYPVSTLSLKLLRAAGL